MSLQKDSAEARYAAIPTWMRDARRWLLWKSQPQAHGKPRKIPFYTNGLARKATDTPTDLSLLVSFSEARTALDAAPGRYTGLGFALGPDGAGSVWQGVDLDDFNARPHLCDLAIQLLGYVELSPSGTGFHAIGYGSPFQTLGSNGTGVEAYSSGRFFAVTGIAVPVSATEKVCLASIVASILAAIHNEGRGSSAAKASSNPKLPTTPELLADLQSALAVLSADSRSDWIAIGQALCTLGEPGFALWAEWSAKSPKFQGEQDLQQWHTFVGERTGYAAVFARAQAIGWVNPRSGPDPATLFGNAPVPTGARLMEPCSDDGITEVAIADLLTNPPQPPEFLIEEMLPAGVVTLLGAHGGAGKSMLALHAGVSLALGVSFFGKAVRRCRVIFYSAEDNAQVIRHRLHRICRQMNVDPIALSNWLKIFDATSNPVLFAETKANGVKSGVPLYSYKWLSQEAEKFAAEAIIVDNASDTFDANEIERARVREFIRLLPKLRQGRGVAVLLLAHVDKLTARGASGSEAYSGSTAWHNSVRSRWSLTKQGDLLTLEHHKSNLGKLAEPICLSWNDVGLLEMAKAAGNAESRLLVLQMIDELYRQGVFISPAPTAPNNAYKSLRADGRFPRTVTRDGLNNMLNSAIRDLQLMIENFTGPNRHIRQRYRLAPTALRQLDATNK